MSNEYRKRRKSQITEIVGFHTLCYRKTVLLYKIASIGCFTELFTASVVQDDNGGYFTIQDLMRYAGSNQHSILYHIRQLLRDDFIEKIGRKTRFSAIRYSLTNKGNMTVKYYNRVMIRLLEERKPDIWGNSDSIRYIDIKAAKQKKKKQKKETG